MELLTAEHAITTAPGIFRSDLVAARPVPRRTAMADADYGMNDFRLIRYSGRGRFLPRDARAIHLAQVRWLRIKLAEKFLGPTIVVTHHLPHRQASIPGTRVQTFNPSFASDLPDLMGPPVSLWIHGHTHESRIVRGARVRASLLE